MIRSVRVTTQLAVSLHSDQHQIYHCHSEQVCLRAHLPHSRIKMEATRAERLFELRAVDVAAHHIQGESSIGKQDSVQTIQTSHRFDILYAWLVGTDPLVPASVTGSDDTNVDWELLAGRVMDLGCGQGDQTGAITAIIASQPQRFLIDGQMPQVIGVDPASPDYGSPYTLNQAQNHLVSDPFFGGYLTFLLGWTGPQALELQAFNTVVLAHSLWYFPSPVHLKRAFKAIKDAGSKHLLLAEWALTASHPNSLPHLLSALLQGQSPVAGSNVQMPISPDQIKALALEAGWKVKRELTFCPAEKLQDGAWEYDMAKEAAQETAKLKVDHDDQVTRRMVQSVEATWYALQDAKRRCGKQTRSMDVWTAVLTPA